MFHSLQQLLSATGLPRCFHCSCAPRGKAMSESPPLLTPFVAASTPAKSAASKNGSVKAGPARRASAASPASARAPGQPPEGLSEQAPDRSSDQASGLSPEAAPNDGQRRARRARRETDTPRPLSIGDAAALLDLETYVLRFWESEFPELRPLRTAKGQRRYAPEHIELLRRIRHLVHERGFTLDGARRALADETCCEDGLLGASVPPHEPPPESTSPVSTGQGAALPTASATAMSTGAEQGAQASPCDAVQGTQPLLRADFIHEMLAELHHLRGMLSGSQRRAPSVPSAKKPSVPPVTPPSAGRQDAEMPSAETKPVGTHDAGGDAPRRSADGTADVVERAGLAGAQDASDALAPSGTKNESV